MHTTYTHLKGFRIDFIGWGIGDMDEDGDFWGLVSSGNGGFEGYGNTIGDGYGDSFMDHMGDGYGHGHGEQDLDESIHIYIETED